jgi:GT2 family glycosyltransferase
MVDTTPPKRQTGSGCDVVAILLTVDQRDLTLRCLDSLRRVDRPRLEIALWDNGSRDGTSRAVSTAHPGVEIHREPSNVGVASGRNGAARLAAERFAPRFFFFLDNDMVIEPDCLAALATPFDRDPLVAQTTGKIRQLGDRERLYGAGGCRTIFWRGDTRHVGYGELDRGQYDAPASCIPSGGCMLVRREVFEELGGFDTTFDPYGPEDLDFGLRAVAAGYHGIYVPEAVVYHESTPGRTFEGGQYTGLFASTRVRHWLTLLRRHATLVEKAGFFFLGAPYLMVVLLERERKRGNLWTTLRGLLRGFVESTAQQRRGEK